MEEKYFVPEVVPQDLLADITKSFYTGDEFMVMARATLDGKKKGVWYFRVEVDEKSEDVDHLVESVKVTVRRPHYSWEKVGETIRLSRPGLIFRDEVESLAEGTLAFIRNQKAVVPCPTCPKSNSVDYDEEGNQKLSDGREIEREVGTVHFENHVEKDLRTRILSSVISGRPFMHNGQTYLVKVEKCYDPAFGWQYYGSTYKLLRTDEFQMPQEEADYVGKQIDPFVDSVEELLDSAVFEITEDQMEQNQESYE